MCAPPQDALEERRPDRAPATRAGSTSDGVKHAQRLGSLGEAATRTPEQLVTFFDALAAWAADAGGPTETVRYGDHPDQELDLRIPPGPGPQPVAIVLHGGFWRPEVTRRNMAALAVALTAAGWTTANIEYRRLGPGTYRQLLEDVETAAHGLDATIAIGHSAGGHLALWL